LLLEDPYQRCSEEDKKIIQKVLFGIARNRNTTILIASENVEDYADVADKFVLLSQFGIVRSIGTK